MNVLRKDRRLAVSLCFSTLLSFLFFFSACGSSDGQFHLEGQFKNINQGEFYIYNLEHGTKDTIAVHDGRFTYTSQTTDTVVLALLFPNYSELPIVAQPNATVKMDGDVTHLRETTVKGTKANEQMTAFRQAVGDLSPQEAADQAARFITDHPASVLCTYLLRRFFLTVAEPDYERAIALCTAMHEAQPQNIYIIRLLSQLRPQANTALTGPLPAFKAVDTRGDTVTNRLFEQHKVGVICLWSSWNYDSQNVLRMLRSMQKEHPRRLAVMTVCLDAAPSEGRHVLERDSITWPNVCDSLLWQSPLLAQLGLQSFPGNIVIGTDGTIAARNLNNADLKDRLQSLLKSQKDV